MTTAEKLQRVIKGLQQDRETVAGTGNEADAPLLAQYDEQIAGILAAMEVS